MSTHSVLLACGLLLVGVILRARVRALAAIHVPAALVAGVLGLLLVQAGPLATPASAEWIRQVGAEWSGWRTPLVPIIFAGMLLFGSGGRASDNFRETAQQAIAAWIIILGQLAIGLAVTLAVLVPVFGVPVHFGQLLEVSWAGGFGSSAAWGTSHARLNSFPAAGYIATFMTACGLVYGVLCGVVLVNVGLRKGWVAGGIGRTGRVDAAPEAPATGSSGLSGDIVDPLLFQILLLAAAFEVGVLLQRGIGALAGLAPDGSLPRAIGSQLPLFVFTLVGGWVVRRLMVALGRAELLDEAAMHRLTGVALELLIFAAVATLEMRAVRDNFAPLAVLMAAGAAWVLFTVLWVSPRILPRSCWFELAMLNHGFATATTAQGMMLLRMIDRDFRTDAARVYALAAPLTAMFIGGGVITYALPLLLERGAAPAGWAVCAGATVAAGVLYLVGRRLARAG
jgi:ESS family glutamate:Na+ symporter